MAEEIAPQRQEPDWGTNILWSASLGGILGICLACIYYFGWENDTPNIFNGQDGLLVYGLPLALLFFLTSLLRGRLTGHYEDVLRIALIACLVQALVALPILLVFSQVFNFWKWDHSGLGFALFGYDDEAGSFGYGFSTRASAESPGFSHGEEAPSRSLEYPFYMW